MEKVIVFGAGQVARRFIEQLDKTQYSILEVWDNKVYGNKIFEYDIVKPHNYLDFTEEIDKVVLAVGQSFLDEIKDQCAGLGIPQEIIEIYYADNLDEIVYNVEGTDYSKKALFVFIKSPFQAKNEDSVNHVNFYEAKAIASALQKMKYNVDVVDYRSEKKFSYCEYDLIIGLGEQFDYSLQLDNVRKTKRILYATGACITHSSVAAIERSKALLQRKGVYIKPERMDTTQNFNIRLQSIALADGILLIGNDWTKSTYANLNDNVYKVGAIGFNNYCMNDIKRNIESARKNFIYFTGSGMVHKGLDLCIEAFAQMPQYNLYIVGKREEEFEKIYSKELQFDNIHMLGFVNTASEEYRQICENCCFTLCFSCSEGICTSIATTMHMGMIPIVTRSSGVDVEDFGFELENCGVDDVIKIIEIAGEMPEEKVIQMTQKSYEYAKLYYTKERFEKQVYCGLKELLCTHNI